MVNNRAMPLEIDMYISIIEVKEVYHKVDVNRIRINVRVTVGWPDYSV